MFKKNGALLSGMLSAFLMVLVCSCQNAFIEKVEKRAVLEETGSLVIRQGESRALNASDMSYSKVSVSGVKADGEIFTINSSEQVILENGTGSCRIENIPAGKNRIVTVFAYDSENTKLGTVMVRKVLDIASGDNELGKIDKSTTAIANVFYALLNSGYNVSLISAAQKTSIESAIDSSKSWTLIDTARIAADFKTGGTSGLKSASEYVLSTGSVSFTNFYAGCTVQIGDPVSSIKMGVSTGSGSVTNVAPGTWPVYVIVSGETVIKNYVTVNAGSDTNIGNLGTVTDRIIVHYPVSGEYKNIYVWVGTNTELFGAWPGTAMKDSDGDGWYDVEISETSCNLIFNGTAGQTGNLSREAGEWWYDGSTWYDENPDDEEAPVLESFTCSANGALTGEVEFNISASDNKGLKTAVVSLDGAPVKTVSLSGTVYNNSVSIDTSDFANGTHSVSCVVYDKAENLSNVVTLVSLVFQNENKPPVAKITGPGRAAPGKTVEYSAEYSTDKNGTVTGYEWSVTGAVTASGTASTISVTAPNTEDSSFTVKLRVKDNDGAWSEWVSQTVTVKTVKSNDFREETIYFLMTARFYDGDSSNNRWTRPDDEGTTKNKESGDYPWRGDFKGLIEKLDYIKALGFSAIWITPPVLNRSDYDYHGYHAWNMNKIDPRLESTGADYQALIDACHEKGIKVIQDIVLNHSCRYGLEDLFSVKYYGSKNITWDKGKGIGAEYYDDYNPNFTYNGLDYEPNSGRSYYNGDLWQENAPSISWDTVDQPISSWGVHNQQYDYYLFQWPTLTLFNPKYFHPKWLGNWEDITCQTGTIHEDCIDLNTEDPDVQKYLIDAYSRYIQMGVDGFRIDTVKHINRVMFNRRFIPAFKAAAEAAGNEHFYMFGEVCTKVNEVWNKNNPSISAPFYTWAESEKWSEDDAAACAECYAANHEGINGQPTSDNAFLKGNDYHTPDYKKSSGLNVIDFPMHMNFTSAGNAYGMKSGDCYYNDATWNVVYVDSHDYGPVPGSSTETDHAFRFDGGADAWAENMTFMWTFRGIPCLYYGSEIEFMHGAKIDSGCTVPLNTTGRAYYGDHLEGTVTATDYGEWTGATGTIASTLANPLCAHLARLNKIRRAIPALQKGQYSNDDCDGGMCYKRRFTDAANGIDSFVLVTVSGGATFKNLPGGTYIDVVTGNRQVIGDGGTLTASCSGQGNARIYVLQNATATEKGANKQIGDATNWLK